jgi:hypothetical protein
MIMQLEGTIAKIIPLLVKIIPSLVRMKVSRNPVRLLIIITSDLRPHNSQHKLIVAT